MQNNEDKSKVICFGNHSFVGLGSVQQVQVLRVLGVLFDSAFSFRKHALHVAHYIRRRRYPLRYMRYLGLSEGLLRAYSINLRQKYVYGLWWLPYVSASSTELLERSWVGVLRDWTGADNTISRIYVYTASGCPPLSNFANYLMLKRAASWHEKKLPRRPFLKPQELLGHFGMRRAQSAPTHKYGVRESTKKAHTDSVYNRGTRLDEGKMNLRLFSIMTPELQHAVSKWDDRKVRRLLGAHTCKEVWPQATRRLVYKRVSKLAPKKK